MPDTTLPRIAAGARFVPFHQVGGRAHVVVDGPASPGSVLGLSHWPDGGVPDHLAADTSAEIVVRYLAADPAGPEVALLTNNHYDEDGLLAAWLALERPGDAEQAAAVAAAEAGDFRTWTDPRAAWAALTMMAAAERPTTPFPDVLRALSTATAHDPAGDITIALLPHVGSMLMEPERYRRLWETAWDAVERDIELIESGAATIDEVAGADLAVIRAPRRLHPLAVMPRVGAMRVLSATAGGRHVLEHRYETWVRYVSRPLPPRRDLAAILPALQAMEPAPVRWRFEGVRAPQGRLFPADANGAPAASGIPAERLVDLLRGPAPDPEAG